MSALISLEFLDDIKLNVIKFLSGLAQVGSWIVRISCQHKGEGGLQCVTFNSSWGVPEYWLYEQKVKLWIFFDLIAFDV